MYTLIVTETLFIMVLAGKIINNRSTFNKNIGESIRK